MSLSMYAHAKAFPRAIAKHVSPVSQALVALAFLGLFAATLARGTIFGDPSEYQFIPAIWGIAHPPGYAFYTLLAGAWQRVVRIGTVAYRTNLLSAFVGAWIVSRVVALGYLLLAGQTAERESAPEWWSTVSAVVGGLAVGLSPDVWQHSIHANAHIVSAAITVTQLWVLVVWSMSRKDVWLYALAFLAAVGVTHHPITIWGIPAYAAFILLQRPGILKQWRVLLGALAAGLIGLSPWLYFPARSPQTPFGPTDMATWKGFLRHATAQGLRVNLFHFGLADQPDRLFVLGNLLSLQFGMIVLGLVLLGLICLMVQRTRVGLLWAFYLLGHLIFTINSVQDVMAYLLHVFIALGPLIALGLIAVVRWIRGTSVSWLSSVVLVIVIGLVIGRGGLLLPRITLASWRDADYFVDELSARFMGRGQGASLVADWEHLTPLFYHLYVEHLPLTECDLHPIYVTGDQPWLESVLDNVGEQPVFLTNYRREVRGSGLRVRPEGTLWRVLEPPALEPVRPGYVLDNVWVDDRLEVLGYDLSTAVVEQGDLLVMTLYARVPVAISDILMPYADLDGHEYRWTTDSRRLTPDWMAGEIIAERYEIPIAYDFPIGPHTLRLGYWQMTEPVGDLQFRDGDRKVALTTIDVVPSKGAPRRTRWVRAAIANFENEVALRSTWMQSGIQARVGAWNSPLRVRPGDTLHLTLLWQALKRPSRSYTVFIHLLDQQGRLWLGHDYTPLGGAYPSYLWFPKWLEGQLFGDPYRLDLPDNLPPGSYWLEVGLYEMGSIRRLALLDDAGTLNGDRFVLGPIEVSP